MAQLAAIFLNVLVPVFLLVALGYYAGPRLGLDSRTLSRFAYYILIPAYVFDVLSGAQIGAALAGRMALYATAVHLACAAAGYLAARALRRPPQIVAAYVLIAVFGNVGNFGIPIIRFRFPDDEAALVAGTVYFVAVSSVAFVVSVAAANWHRRGVWRAALAAATTPALLALPPALLVNAMGWALPPALARPVELLSDGMIPTMLIALGVQLAAAGVPRPDGDMALASAIRLVGGPALALLLAAPFGIEGLARSTGVLQAAMPTAVLASIIAVENDVAPPFVITAVLLSTLASLVTLTAVLAIV